MDNEEIKINSQENPPSQSDQFPVKLNDQSRVTQLNFISKLGDVGQFLKNNLKRPQTYYVLGALLVVVVGGVFFYQTVVLKEEISEFTLTPKIADAAGIDPGTAFILTSSADLNTAVVQDYLKFEPEVEYKIKKTGGGSSVFEITPKAILDTDKVYSISIAAGPIAARDYGWAYQVKAPFQIISTLPRDKASGVPINTGIEITFNRENVVNPENNFSISPSVPGRFEIHRNTVVFVPTRELQERTLYSIKIKSGIKIEGSNDTLGEDTIISFETTEKYFQSRSSFGFDKTFWEFQPDNDFAFEVFHSNLPSNSVSLWAYKFDSLDEFLDEYNSSVDSEFAWTRYHSSTSVTPDKDKRIFASEVTLEEQGRTRFIRLPQELEEGYYMADVLIDDRHSQAWFQVTPIASFSAVSGKESLLWLKDLGSGNNIANAEIYFEGKLLGKTNSDGTATFVTPELLIESFDSYSYYYRSSLEKFFTIKTGGKQLVVPVEDQDGYATTVSQPDAWWDYLSIDKSVYLPSDTVRFWGIVKQRNDSDVRGEEITIQLTDPYWYGSRDEVNVYGETKVDISDFYTVTGEVFLQDLKPGLYQLSVVRGNEVIVSENVSVETFIKPAYRMIIEPDKKVIFAGDSIDYQVKAEFFDGTPVSNLKVEYNGYFQGNISGEIQLNQEGEGSFKITTSYSEGQYNYWPKYLGMNISPAVAEEGEIDASVSVLVFGPQLDMKVNQSFAEKTTKFELQIKNIVLDQVEEGKPYWYSDNYLGIPVGGVTVNVNVTEIIHKKTETGKGYDIINKVTYPIYQYSTEERSITDEALTTRSDGKAFFEWTPEQGKTYRITFTARDSQGRLVSKTRHAYGSSFSYFGSYDPRGIVLKNLADESNYKIGDEIQLQIQDNAGSALIPSPNNFVYLKVRNGSISYEITGSSDYRNTFKEDDIPNVSVIGVWFGGSRFHNTRSITLSFDDEERNLNIDIRKDKERYRPRDKVRLDLTVTDNAGRPKQAEVNVAGIDEAIFALRSTEKDITSNLYRNISSSLLTRTSHISPLEDDAERGGCFLPGTLVLTPSGLVPIEELKPGDKILTHENEGSGKLVEATVARSGSYLVDGYLTVNDNLNLSTNHSLWVNGEWQKAGQLKLGDSILDTEGNAVEVTSLHYNAEWLYVYNIEVADYHTFFADGIYVHNEEKGGGSARADFRDNAVYRSVTTDSRGRATVEFDVPDNLTSWRITAQAVSKDLYAGKSIDFVPVGLPFFVETAINRSYLAGDNLILRARVFGTSNVKNNITYSVESETLPFGKIEVRGGSSIEIPLGELTVGDHSVQLTVSSGSLSDSIIRKVSVVDSYFSQDTSEFYELSPTLTNITGSNRGFTTLTFSSYERGRFYHALRSFACCQGVRIDQKLTGQFARTFLNQFFEEGLEEEDINATDYQMHDGGITLLPYSDKDLALSAKFANLIKDENVKVDREGIKQYLNATLSDRSADIARTAIALYGLTAFDEPVLVTLQNIKDDKNLTLMDKIYVALALNSLGAKEEARNYYKSEIKSTLKKQSRFIFVDSLGHQDDNIIATVLLANLTVSLSEAEADGLADYAMTTYPKETLKNFEMLLFLKEALPRLKGGSVSFSYNAGSKSDSKTLDKGEKLVLKVSPEELSNISFSNIDGRIGLVSNFRKEIIPAEISKDSAISVTRRYSVDGVTTNEFREGDLVKIDLTPSFQPSAFPGVYQIVDHLPSGLRTVTNIQRVPIEPGVHYHTNPSQIEDQRVTFITWKEFPRSFFYYARVVSKGDYKAEPVMIQSLKSLESINISNEVKITIP